MNRINIYEHDNDYGPPRLVGWFDPAKADRWSDQDHNSHGCFGLGRGEAVVRASGGRWVLEHWTIWSGEASSYSYIGEDAAREWLLCNEYDDAVEEYFGAPAEEEDRRPPGRPEEGRPVNVRLPESLISELDERAARGGTSRAEMVRELLTSALA